MLNLAILNKVVRITCVLFCATFEIFVVGEFGSVSQAYSNRCGRIVCVRVFMCVVK